MRVPSIFWLISLGIHAVVIGLLGEWGPSPAKTLPETPVTPVRLRLVSSSGGAEGRPSALARPRPAPVLRPHPADLDDHVLAARQHRHRVAPVHVDLVPDGVVGTEMQRRAAVIHDDGGLGIVARQQRQFGPGDESPGALDHDRRACGGE